MHYAQGAELQKKCCYDIPVPQFENSRTVKCHADKTVCNTYRYVIMDGKYYEQCDDYERGISYHFIGNTECDMIAHLIYETVWQFAINKAAMDGLYGDNGENEAALITKCCFSELPEEYQPYYEHRSAQRKGI